MTKLVRAPKGPGGYVRTDDPGEPVFEKPRVSITDLEATILAAFAMELNVLEIGTGLGVSTRALATYAENVTTYDIDPWVQTVIWDELRYETCNVWFTLTPEKHSVDLVFIDGDHSTPAVQEDIRIAHVALGGYGLIVVHDANYDTVRRALDDTWTIIPTEHGLGLKIVDAAAD